MFNYYSATVFITVFTMAIMVIIVRANKVINSNSKEVFLITFLTCILASIIEWIGVYSQSLGPEFRNLTIICNFFMMMLIPTLPLFLAASLSKERYVKHIEIFVLTNLVFQVISLYSGYVFYVDEFNVFHRGVLFNFNIAILFMSLLILLMNLLKLSKKYQNKDNYIVYLVLIIFIFEIYLQMLNIGNYIFWISSAISMIAIYNYYTMLISQSDAVTSLLVRGCFENRLESIDRNCVFILFDVNDFKKINDNYGHTFGDKTLAYVSKCIFDVYSKYGYCYRIGGDEFCVIIDKNVKSVEELNDLFQAALDKVIEEDSRVPSVSLGYCEYNKASKDLKATLETADKMMYENKSKIKNS